MRRRALVRRWVRGAVAIALFLALPTVFTHLLGAPGHRRDRVELSGAVEREQRANGVPFVTSSGDTVRAVVYSPTASRVADDAQHRGLVWWSRLLAAATALGLLTGTWRTLRETSSRSDRDGPGPAP